MTPSWTHRRFLNPSLCKNCADGIASLGDGQGVRRGNTHAARQGRAWRYQGVSTPSGAGRATCRRAAASLSLCRAPRPLGNRATTSKPAPTPTGKPPCESRPPGWRAISRASPPAAGDPSPRLVRHRLRRGGSDAAEALERRLDELGQCREVVAPLEHGGDPRSQPRRARGELLETASVDSSSCASGSSTWASNPAETSSSSGSKRRDRALRLRRTPRGRRRRPFRRRAGCSATVSPCSSGPPVPG